MELVFAVPRLIRHLGCSLPFLKEHRFRPWPLMSFLASPITRIRGELAWRKINPDHIKLLRTYYQIMPEYIRRYVYAEDLELAFANMRRRNNFASISQIIFELDNYERGLARVFDNGGIGLHWPIGGSYLGVASISFSTADSTFNKTKEEDGRAWVEHFYDDDDSLWEWEMSMRYDNKGDNKGECASGLCTRKEILEYQNTCNSVRERFNRL